MPKMADLGCHLFRAIAQLIPDSGFSTLTKLSLDQNGVEMINSL